MEIDPNTGTPVSGVAKRKHPLLLCSPPPERLKSCAMPGSEEFHEILGDIDDNFSMENTLTENAVATKERVEILISYMQHMYKDLSRGRGGRGRNTVDHFKFNTLSEYAIAAMTRMVEFIAFLEEEENSVQDDPPPRTSNEFFRQTEIDELKSSVISVQDSLASMENKIDVLTHQSTTTKSFADIAKEAGGRSPSQVSRFQNPVVELATASPSVAAAVKPKKSSKNVAAFGTVIYQNAIVLQNFTKEVPTHQQERCIFLANFLNERLSGRLRPVAPETIVDVTEESAGCFTLFFHPDYSGVEDILENAFCFSSAQKYAEASDRVYLSPLLSPDDLRFLSKARGMALNICKGVFKEQDWWSIVKIYTVGRKLKIRTATADGQGFINTFFRSERIPLPFR